MQTRKICWSQIARGPVFAAACLLAGGVAAGSLWQTESRARAFSQVMPDKTYTVPGEVPTSTPAVRSVPVTAPTAPIIELGPMIIVGEEPTHAAAPAATRVPTPCTSGWHELEQGPIGRRVLTTCGDGSAQELSNQRANRGESVERLDLPKLSHGGLMEFSRGKGREPMPGLVIGDPKPPRSE